MDKKQREERRRQEDKALNQGLIWVGGAILLEMALLFVKRWYFEYLLNDTAAVDRMFALDKVLRYTRVGGIVLAAACLVWLAVQLKSKKKTDLPAFLPAVLAIVFVVLALCAHVTLAFRENGMQMLLLLVPSLAGIALVFYLYQREFFLSALAAGLSVMGLWFVRACTGFSFEVALSLLGIALVLAVTLLVRRGNGQVSVAGIQIQVLPKGASCTLALCTCLAALAALGAAAVLGATAAYYLIILMLAWLFGLLVYYTVKMM